MLWFRTEQQQEVEIWRARRGYWCHLHPAPPSHSWGTVSCSRCIPHKRCTQPSSSPLDTLMSSKGIWKSSCFFFGITCSEEGLQVQEGGSILLSEGRHLFFLCESQSEGPQGAVISNFLPTPTPSHWLLLLPRKAVSFLFYNLHRLQRESTPPRLLRPS